MPILPSRINARIILIVSCILLSTGVISGWITARKQTSSLLASKSLNSTIMVKNFAESSAHFLLVQDYAGLESYLLKSAELPDIRRLIVSEPDGDLVWDIKHMPNGQIRAATGIEKIPPPLSRSTLITFEKDLLIIWEPIVAGNMLGWLKAEFSLSAIREAQKNTWEQTLFLTLAWIICSASLIILILRPTVLLIGRITSFAKQLDERKGAQIQVPEHPIEIAELVTSLNEASNKLFLTEQQLLNERERIQKSEQNYRQLLDTIQEGIWVIDANAVTTFVNPRMAELLCYTQEEMIGMQFYEFMDEQGRQIAEVNLERRKQGIKDQHDFEFIRKDGERIYTRLETGPIFDENGQYAGSIAAVADISGQKKNEEEILKLNEELDQRVKQRTAELEAKNAELQKLNRIFVGRELRMVELKERIRDLEGTVTERGGKTHELV